MTTATLHLDMTMSEIMERFPGARRALFQRFHIGGCQSCGFQPADSLRAVLQQHQVSDVDAALQTILEFEAADRRMQIAPTEVAELRRQATPMRLIDVRTEDEWDIARIEGAELLTQELFDELRAAAKDTKLVFYCHSGMRSLDAAAYFAGHGFSDARSMTGGILAWADQVEPDMPRY